MTAKRTPFRRRATDRRGGSMRYGVARALGTHPWWSWSSIGVVVAILTLLSPWLSSMFGLIDTVSAAKEREAKLEQKINEQSTDLNNKITAVYTRIEQLALSAKEHNAADARMSVGTTLGLLENKLTASVGRVNNCNIARQGKHMTDFERQVCFQYDADYAETKRRYEAAQVAANQTWTQR